MQSITQSQLLPYLLAMAAFLVAGLLILYIIRLVFGRRIRAPGPRNRPRRLDVVDAFELDRERQLVIVRRDNTEHLLLIGGPNDLLVEGSIHRGEATGPRAEARETRPETREPRPVAPGWPAPPVPAEEAARISAQEPPAREPTPQRQPVREAPTPVSTLDALSRRAPEPPPVSKEPQAPRETPRAPEPQRPQEPQKDREPPKPQEPRNIQEPPRQESQRSAEPRSPLEPQRPRDAGRAEEPPRAPPAAPPPTSPFGLTPRPNPLPPNLFNIPTPRPQAPPAGAPQPSTPQSPRVGAPPFAPRPGAPQPPSPPFLARTQKVAPPSGKPASNPPESAPAPSDRPRQRLASRSSQRAAAGEPGGRPTSRRSASACRGTTPGRDARQGARRAGITGSRNGAASWTARALKNHSRRTRRIKIRRAIVRRPSWPRRGARTAVTKAF